MIDRPDLAGKPLSERMLYPGDYWDEDREAQREQELDAARNATTDASVVAIVDSDADGRGCEVVLRDRFGDDVGVIPAGHRGDISLVEAIELVAEHAPDDVRLIIADLCPDESEIGGVADALAGFADVTVCDHHEWTDRAKNVIGEVATLVLVGDKCATQIVLEEFNPDADAHLREFADVTADHDLGIKEDDRSDDLSDLSFWADRETYVEAALEHGANLADDEAAREILNDEREEKRGRTRLAVENASWHDVNGYAVAIAYGEAHATTVGHELVEEGADIAVLIPPYNKVSFRTAEDASVAHLIARELGGGGHENAAGAKPGLVGGRGDVPYDEHWETLGEYVRQHVLDAIKHATALHAPQAAE